MISFYKKIIFALLLLTPFVRGNEKKLNITVDPRIELLSVVQYLSGYGDFGLITRFDFKYKNEVIKYFTPYKEQEAIKLFSEMSQESFAFDAPPTAMLFLSDPPALKIKIPITQYIVERAGSKEALEKFIDALRKFAVETKFMSFYNEHKPVYEKIVKGIRDKIGDNNYVGEIEKYYGISQKSYNIIVALLLHQGGFGPRIEREKNRFDLYSIVGPQGVKDSMPDFGTAENYRYLIWHEFSHSFINPLTEQYADRINEVSSLFNPIKERMGKIGYPQWNICVNEHLVRTVTVRLSYIYNGMEDGDRAIQAEKARGFIYLPDICKKLKEYENNRDKYPTFADFYPEIIKLFSHLTLMKHDEDYYYMPFEGTINSVLNSGHPFKLIIPTNESDKGIQNKIKEYVDKVQKRFYKNGTVIKDQEALMMDLSHYSLVIYGTPTGNLWIKKYMEQIPVKIETDKIIADSVYLGNDLRYITAWPNPQNHKVGVIIYTAQRAEDIVEINSVFHGPTDFVVAQGKNVIKSANYKR